MPTAAFVAKVMHTAWRCVLQALASDAQREVTWHSFSAFCLQKSATVTGVDEPPPPQLVIATDAPAAATTTNEPSNFQVLVMIPPKVWGSFAPRRRQGQASL